LPTAMIICHAATCDNSRPGGVARGLIWAGTGQRVAAPAGVATGMRISGNAKIGPAIFAFSLYNYRPVQYRN